MAFRHRQRHFPAIQAVAHFANLCIVDLPGVHQLIPRRGGIAQIQLALEHRLVARSGLNMWWNASMSICSPASSCMSFAHPESPQAIILMSDRRPHRLGELDRLCDRRRPVEAVVVVRRLIAKLPVANR